MGTDHRQQLLVGVPLTERRVRLADATTALLEGGEGPPLILLHGGIECGGAYWAPVIPALAESHRVIVPDVPGLGESEPVARLDATTFAVWLSDLLRATCHEPPTLIAHSLLGSLAAHFAVAHGDSLRRLVIYGAPAVGPYRMPLGLRVVAIRFALLPTDRNLERFERWAFFDLDQARRRDPVWLAAFSEYTRARAANSHVKRTMRQLVRAGTKPLPDPGLDRITVATALLWGRHDRFVALGLAEAATSRLGWPLHVIDDAGHVPHIERPDAFVDALRNALDPTVLTEER